MPIKDAQARYEYGKQARERIKADPVKLAKLRAQQRAYEQTPTGRCKNRWSVHKQVCKKRGWEPLTYEQFSLIYNQPCVMCGAPPPGGVDRINSALPYSVDNCQPMCWMCNRAKGKTEQAEFFAWMQRVLEFQRSKQT